MNDAFREALRTALQESIEPPSPELPERVLAALPAGAPAAGGLIGLLHELFRHWLSTLSIVALTTTAVAAAVFASSPPTLNFRVYVAYADSGPASEHQNPPDFPNPWLTGEAARGPFDAGAIRIENASDAPLTIERAWVEVGTRRYELWGTGLQVPAHGRLILTQTRITRRTPLESDFDSSEADGLRCAAPSNTTPVVQLVIGGRQYAYNDTEQVLLSGGRDLGSCPGQPNESHAWVLLSLA